MKRKKIPKEERRSIFEKFGGRCAYCGCDLDPSRFSIDHVVPISNGGRNSMENLFPSCLDCNSVKGKKSVEGFRKEIKQLPAHLLAENRKYKTAFRFGFVAETDKKDKAEFFFEMKNAAQSPVHGKPGKEPQSNRNPAAQMDLRQAVRGWLLADRNAPNAGTGRHAKEDQPASRLIVSGKQVSNTGRGPEYLILAEGSARGNGQSEKLRLKVSVPPIEFYSLSVGDQTDFTRLPFFEAENRATHEKYYRSKDFPMCGQPSETIGAVAIPADNGGN